jgi:exosome complex exonuclease DIS3/RRP44
MNRRHRAAQLAGRASVQLHTLIFFAGDGEKEEDAYVLDVETGDGSEPSFTVMVPRYGIEGRVKISISADDPNLVRSPEKHRLTYKQGTKTTTLQVLDKVKVRIWVREVQDHQRELVLDLVEPTFGAPVEVPEPIKKHSRDVAKTADATSSRPKRRKAK